MADTAKALEALKQISAPADYFTFWKMAKAAKAAGLDYIQFDNWAKSGQGYNEKQNRTIWEGIRLDGKITEATLFYLAMQAGWQPPKDYKPEPGAAVDYSRLQSNSRQEQAASAGETAGAAVMAQRHIAAAAQNRAQAMAYLQGRGITAQTAERFNLGHTDRGGSKHNAAALIIPYPGANYYTERNTQTEPNADREKGWRYNYPGGLTRELFNAPALRNGAPIVFVVEGQIDAISIEQAGYSAVAYGGNGGDALLINELAKGGNATAQAFYIIPDNDTDNDNGLQQAVKTFDAVTAKGYRACLWCLPDGFHDVNDLLVKGGADSLKGWLAGATADLEREAAQERAEYQAITPAGSIDGFMAAITDGQPVVKTGFSTLDDALNGGLTDGFVILGALSSMGKTTFCLQMADQIAAMGERDILYIALEQGKIELMAKSISRQLYQKYIKVEATEYNGQPKVMAMADYRQEQGHYTPLEHSALEIRTRYRYIPSDGKQAIARALREYASGAGKNIYYREARGADVNASHVRQAVAEHKAKTGNAPIVIIDYLQLLATDYMRDGRGALVPKARDEREILNNSIKSLTAISRDFNTVVIGISAFNRNSYGQQAGMESFNGSSRIEYSADVLMALEPDRTAVVDDGFSWDELKGGGKRFNAKKFAQHYGADKNGQGGVMPMALTLLKNRNGRKDIVVSLDYKPKCDTFTDKAAEVDLSALLAQGGADAQ